MNVPTVKKMVAFVALGKLVDAVTGVYMLPGVALTLEADLA